MASNHPPYGAYAQDEEYELQQPRSTIDLNSLKSRKKSRKRGRCGGIGSLFRCCMGFSDGAFKAYNMCILTVYAVVMIGLVVMLLLAWHWVSKAYNDVKGDVVNVLHDVEGVVHGVKENVEKVKAGVESVESLVGKAGAAAKSVVGAGESAASSVGAAILSEGSNVKSKLNSIIHLARNDHPRTTLLTIYTMAHASGLLPTATIHSRTTPFVTYNMVNASHPLPTEVPQCNPYSEAYNGIRTAGQTLCDQSRALTSAGFNLCFQDLYSRTTTFCDFVVSGQFPAAPISEKEDKACRLYIDLQGVGVTYCSRSTEVVVENKDETDAMFLSLIGFRATFCDVTSSHGRNVSVMGWDSGDCEIPSFM
ncbi:hypothetical protein BU16DRAFT_531656 [Lophium mytilinum]|uniref:Uncharacterized protein n=1 Tax=Lophium mytilinum TaxID=390894 RepID=A0A6A6QB97_9PEZI|nr:hypothetical protein BU16DRAFT_531656 [Lophium mytilinum]